MIVKGREKTINTHLEREFGVAISFPWAKKISAAFPLKMLSNRWSRCLQSCPTSSSITHTQTDDWLRHSDSDSDSNRPRLKPTQTQTTQTDNHTCIPVQTIDRGGGKCWNRVRLDIYSFSSTSLQRLNNFCLYLPEIEPSNHLTAK